METPDFTEVPNLEKLATEDCINLRGVHPSLLVLKKLTLLNLKGCKNLRGLPNKFEMESLEILVLSGCAKLKRIPEFGTNMQRVMELYLDGTAITKLPASIGHLIGLVSLILRDCKNLMCLPSSCFDLKLLKDLDISRCSKLERLPENLGDAESVEELDVSGTAIRELPSSLGFLKNLKKLSFHGSLGLTPSNILRLEVPPFNSLTRSSDLVGFSYLVGFSSLLSLCSLIELNLSYCNLIPNDIVSSSSLNEIDRSGINFDCLPESMSLRLLPKLLSSIATISASGCTSLKPNSLCEVEPFLSNCSKLADNQAIISIFSTVIRKHFQVGLSLSLSLSLSISFSTACFVCFRDSMLTVDMTSFFMEV